jgi:steroid delta-isomerase-like uncharacterized protein
MPIDQQSALSANKAVAQRFIDGVFVRGDPAAVDELAGADFTPHTWGSMPPGREALKAAMARVGAGVSDTEFRIEDVIAEGDRVVVRLTSSATHTGTFMGMPPTGARYSIPEIHIFRIRDGQVTDHWHEFDKLSLMQQLGGDPSKGPPKT